MRTGGRDFLKTVAILNDLNEVELNLLWKIVKRVEVPGGTVIMREGDVGDSMFFFAEGEVEVTQKLTLKLGSQGLGQGEKSVVKLKADTVSFFGDMAMFENEPRSATITASNDCLLYEIKRRDFEKQCIAFPALGYKILDRIAKVLCQRLRRANRDVLKLTTALSLALSK